LHVTEKNLLNVEQTFDNRSPEKLIQELYRTTTPGNNQYLETEI
jgi:hypothetical protein